MSSCKCSLQIHERRRATRHPVRVPILTVEEHGFLLTIVDIGIKEREEKISWMKRCQYRTELGKGLSLLKAIKRELYKS